MALVAGYVVLVLAWTFAQPPFASPDEDHHYVRALGVAHGQLAGRSAPWADPGLTPQQLAWANQGTREYDVPARMSPRPGRCLSPATACGRAAIATPVAGYQPLPYLLPAVLVRAGNSPASGDRLARLGGALGWATLLALAAALLWDRRQGAASLVGLAVAVTPMAVFLGATLNGSGLEIAAGVAFAAALLRLAREDRARPWVLASVAITGALLALSRSAGPVWVGIDLALFSVLVGRHRVRQTILSNRLGSAAVAGVLAAAVVLNRVWEAAFGPSLTTGVRPVGDAVREVYWQAGDAMQSAIGWFGALEVKPPGIVYVVWALLVLALGVLALRAATQRERLALSAAALAAIVAPALLVAAVLRHTGFPLQGRHVLPLCVFLPLLAGELIGRHMAEMERLASRLAAAVFVTVAVVQAVCFYVAARFAAGGPQGPWWFLGQDGWDPPLGWLPWLVLGAAGTGLVALAGLGQAESRVYYAPRRGKGSA